MPGDSTDWDGFAQRAAQDELYGRPEDRNPARVEEFLTRHIGCLVGLSILDCGCSVGHWTEDFLKMGLSPTGVDQSEVAISIARSIRPDIPFHRFPLEELSDLDQYDIVCSITVLQHNYRPSRKSIVRNMVRSAKPYGYLFLIEGTGESYRLEDDERETNTVPSLPSLIDSLGSAGTTLRAYEWPGWFLFQKLSGLG